MRVIASPLAVRNSLLSGSEKTVLFMSSSYETWEESATQDKRKGRRTVLATSDDFLKCNRTGHLLQGAPPTTGRADFGAHGGYSPSAGGAVKGRPATACRFQRHFRGLRMRKNPLRFTLEPAGQRPDQGDAHGTDRRPRICGFRLGCARRLAAIRHRPRWPAGGGARQQSARLPHGRP